MVKKEDVIRELSDMSDDEAERLHWAVPCSSAVEDINLQVAVLQNAIWGSLRILHMLYLPTVAQLFLTAHPSDRQWKPNWRILKCHRAS